MSKAPVCNDIEIIEACKQLTARGKSVNGRALQKLLKKGSTPYLNTALVRLRLDKQIPEDTDGDPMLDAIYESIRPSYCR